MMVNLMKKIRLLIIIIILIIIGGVFVVIFLNKHKEYEYIKLNDKIVEEIKEDSTTIELKDNKRVFDKYREEYNNNEIVGKISIKNSDFNMLFAQTKDNDYYLTHLINRDENSLGASFLDYRNDIDISKKINIYGHNNGNNGVSFNYFMNYLDKEFYNEHKRIVISSDLDDYEFEVFSVQIVDESSGYEHMIVEFNNDFEWSNHINNMLNNAIFKEDVDIDKVSRILTLQTCTNRVDWEFLLVHARLIL